MTTQCSTCGETLIWTGMEMQTLVGYGLTEEGHRHDDNCLYRSYRCANGHFQRLYLRRSCKQCDWRGKETCGCHEGVKVDAWPETAVERMTPKAWLDATECGIAGKS